MLLLSWLSWVWILKQALFKNPYSVSLIVPSPTQLAPILASVAISVWYVVLSMLPSAFKNWLDVPPFFTKHLALTALLALILSLTVSVSQLVQVPIDKWPSSWKIISSPFLSMKCAMGCEPSCWTKSAGPVPALTTERAEVVVIDVSIHVNAPKTDKLPVIVVSSVNVFLPPISWLPDVTTTVLSTDILGVFPPDESIPVPPVTAVTVPLQPPLPALKAANCVWILLVTPSRNPYSVLETLLLSPTQLAPILASVAIVSCLASICDWIPLVTPLR